MRRKGEVRLSTKRLAYRFAARFQLHFPRRFGEHEAEVRAARLISDGDFVSAALFNPESCIEYRFKSGAQAHAMQIWFEAHARPYDHWLDRQESWEHTVRSMKQRDDLVNAAAAVGARERLREAWRTGGRRAAVELLQEIGDHIDKMTADRWVDLLTSV